MELQIFEGHLAAEGGPPGAGTPTWLLCLCHQPRTASPQSASLPGPDHHYSIHPPNQCKCYGKLIFYLRASDEHVWHSICLKQLKSTIKSEQEDE